MKYMLLCFILTASIGYAQSYDTTSADAGTPGGYQRIREKDTQGTIHRVWFTTWEQTGITSKEYSEYDLQNRLIVHEQSTYDNNGKLISLRKQRGNTNDQEEQTYTPDGILLRKYLSLLIDGNYIIYRKDYDGEWRYSAVIDGKHPKPTIINQEEFAQAEKIFSQRLTEGHQNDTQCSAVSYKSNPCLVAEFEGNDIRNTTPFEVTSPWEVKWDAKGHFFSIYLYSEDGTLINVLGNQNDPGEGSSYFPKAGKYYFSVSTVGDWTVKVVKTE